MAHIGQSRPDSGLGLQVKVLKPFQAVPSSLGSGRGDALMGNLPHLRITITDAKPPTSHPTPCTPQLSRVGGRQAWWPFGMIITTKQGLVGQSQTFPGPNPETVEKPSRILLYVDGRQAWRPLEWYRRTLPSEEGTA